MNVVAGLQGAQCETKRSASRRLAWNVSAISCVATCRRERPCALMAVTSSRLNEAGGYTETICGGEAWTKVLGKVLDYNTFLYYDASGKIGP